MERERRVIAAPGAAKTYLLLSLAVLAAVASSSGQDTSPAAPGTILTVRVEGNQALSSSAVLANVKSRPGQPYNEEVLRDDQRRLLETHRYDSVVASRTLTDKGVIITFAVVERPLVKAVQILGVKSLKMKDIKPLVPFGAGDAIDTHQIEAALEPTARRTLRISSGQLTMVTAQNTTLYVGLPRA